MHLLDASLLIHEGIAELVEFTDVTSLPKYAALSHTWAEDEVLFEDIPLGPEHKISPSSSSLRNRRQHNHLTPDDLRQIEPHVKAGWDKVRSTCQQACNDGLDFVWIDTCCIDKSSSSELSEAINSMWRWYEMAEVCYVHLADCSLPVDVETGLVSLRKQLKHCRWFTRGWTLQELIAPRKLRFYDQTWSFVAEKSDIIPTLVFITGIHDSALRNEDCSRFSIAQRMSWASKRETTRLEDEAYSLLGLFGINMPLIYGEGRRAFARLQEHIISTSPDQSIFAWELRPDAESDLRHVHSLFAPSAANFWWYARDLYSVSTSLDHVPWVEEPDGLRFKEYRLTNQGVQIPLQLYSWREKHRFNISIAYLDCTVLSADGSHHRVGLRLQSLSSLSYTSVDGSRTMYARVTTEAISTLSRPNPTIRRLVEMGDWQDTVQGTPCSILVLREGHVAASVSRVIQQPGAHLLYSRYGIAQVQVKLPDVTSNEGEWRVIATLPQTEWHAQDGVMKLPIVGDAVHAIIVIESESGSRCTVLVGLVHVIEPDQLTSFSGRGFCQYWIFPGPQKYSTWGFSDSHRSLGPVELLELDRLCRSASSFASKDYFEQSSRRNDANKSLLVPNGDVLRLNLDKPEIRFVESLQRVFLGRDSEQMLKLDLSLNLTIEQGANESSKLRRNPSGRRARRFDQQTDVKQLSLKLHDGKNKPKAHDCWTFCKSSASNLHDAWTEIYPGRPGVQGLVPLPLPSATNENVRSQALLSRSEFLLDPSNARTTVNIRHQTLLPSRPKLDDVVAN